MVANYTTPTLTLPFSEDARHFLVIAIAAAGRAGWQIRHVHKHGLTALLPVHEDGVISYARVQIQPQSADIHIESADMEMAALQTEASLADFANAVNEIKYFYTAEELELRYLQLEAAFAPPAPAPPVKEEPFGFFGKAKEYVITGSIVAINVLIFFAMVMRGMDVLDPNSSMMIQWGANYGAYTLDGQWWRLLSSCFLHFGFLHLAMNMYALIYAGMLLETYIGRQRFVAAYLLTGIAASVTSLSWHPYTVSAGASGAIFGMYGVLLAMLTTNIIAHKVRKPMLTSIGFYVVYNLAYGMKDGVDNAAHIGGLLSGMLIGYVYAWGMKQKAVARIRHISTIVLTIVILAASAIAYTNTPNVIRIYENGLKRFTQNEQHSLAIYNLPANATEQQKIQALQKDGLPYWKENKSIIASIDKLRLPDELHTRNRLLQNYADLRVESYTLMLRALQEHTDSYDANLERLDNQVEEYLQRLND